MKHRIEKDSLGTKKVPSAAYYGIFTARALENFNLSGTRPSPELMKAIASVKIASARANQKLGLLEPKKANAIIKAGKEFSRGKFSEEFILDYFQAGAGTPFNMNANEIIANRATELIGGRKGQYKVHPNNDVNMSQSSNDAMPTVVRLTILFQSEALLSELNELSKAFKKKAKEFNSIVKCGRTHYQDAVPITLGQEFNSYASLIDSALTRLKLARDGLKEIPLGGTAIGTGINTHPKYRATVVRALSKETGYKFREPKDHFEHIHSMNAFVDYSSALRVLAISLHKICNDLMFLSSGPKTGIGEIILPEVEPGSSIMPDKVNPSIPEAVKMAAFQIEGADTTVARAAAVGHLEINVYTPVILYSLESATVLASNAVEMFRKKCVRGIKADKKRCTELLESSYSFATALNPYLGYQQVAEIIKEARKKNKTVLEVVRSKKLFTEKELKEILSLKKMTKPQKPNLKLKKKVRGK